MRRIRISRLKCCGSTSDGEKSGLKIFVCDPLIRGFSYKSGPGAAPDHPGAAPEGPGPVLKLLYLLLAI